MRLSRARIVAQELAPPGDGGHDEEQPGQHCASAEHRASYPGVCRAAAKKRKRYRKCPFAGSERHPRSDRREREAVTQLPNVAAKSLIRWLPDLGSNQGPAD